MNPWILASASAALAAIVACGIPELIRSLPAPKPSPTPSSGGEESGSTPGPGLAGGTRGHTVATDLDERSELGAGDSPYVAVAGRVWLRPLAVVISACAAGLIGLVVGPHVQLVHLVALVAMAPGLVALAVLDACTRYLPTRIITPALAFMVGLLVLGWAVSGDPADLIRGVVGFLALRVGFWVLWVLSGTMGFGDVRLAGLLGLITASLDWTTFLYGLYAGLFLAASYALARLAITRDRGTLRAHLPLGPALILGALVGILLGGHGA